MTTVLDAATDVQTKPRAERLRRNAARCQTPQDGTAVMLRKAVVADPDDAAARMALGDHYRELGESAKTADVWVARSVRWGRMSALLTGTGAKSARARAMVRRRAGCDGANNVPITLVGGDRADEAPKVTGEAPYHTFRKGGVCKFPGAARRAGYKTDYHADTRAVTVGVEWLDRVAAEGV